MKRNIELENEDLAILRLFGSECLDDTVKRLGIAAAYSTDRDYKLRVCRLRNEISEWDCTKWIRFYVEEVKHISFKVIAVKEPASLREEDTSVATSSASLTSTWDAVFPPGGMISSGTRSNSLG